MPSEDTQHIESEQADAAAAEAAAIGGQVSSAEDEGVAKAQHPLTEAGQGEAEGFEQAERELIEHASHGDQHAARRAAQDVSDRSDDARAAEAGEADMERSSELGDDES